MKKTLAIQFGIISTIFLSVGFYTLDIASYFSTIILVLGATFFGMSIYFLQEHFRDKKNKPSSPSVKEEGE